MLMFNVNGAARWRVAGLLLLAMLVALFLRLALLQPQTIVDEATHVPQVLSLMTGRLAIEPGIATLPGYHLVVALLAHLTGLSSIGAMRVWGVLFGGVAALAFYAIRRRLDDEHALVSAALFFVFPLFFPYDFLVYTDILSLAVVLLAVLSAVSGRHLLAACIMTLSLVVRQNNVIWAAFLAGYVAWPAFDSHEGTLVQKGRDAVTRALPYVLPAAVFLGYWNWNGSIALSSTVRGGHPDLSLHAGNVWFTLFLFLILFPFEAWKGMRAFATAARARPWLLAILVVALCWVKLRGSGDNHAFLDYFLRNAFIAYVAHGWARIGFALVVGLAACSIAFTRFRDPRGVLVYPFSAVCLASSWLIENRYAMVPFALWMAFRRDESPRWMGLVWLALSSFLTYGVLTRRFML
jgi:hypothetical protein